MRLTTKVSPGLYVGGSWDPDPPDKDWDVVLTVCSPGEVAGSPRARRAYAVSMLDIDYVDEPTVQALREGTANAVRAGAKTLVRCHLGLNRSVLVAALATLDLTGGPTAAVVARLREKRSPDVLSNRTFERYVHGAARLPGVPPRPRLDPQTGGLHACGSGKR